MAAKIWSKHSDIKQVSTIQELKNFYQTKRNYQEEWKVVQEWLYTEGLNYASVNFGARNLIEKLRSQNADLFVVSHKTPVSAFNKADLIQPAQRWIKHNLSDIQELGANNIYFEATRESKIKRIASLGLTHYVDDLLEVLQEENYPRKIKSFWLSLNDKECLSENITAVQNLNSIIDYV